MKHFMNVYDEHCDTDVYVCPMIDLCVYLVKCLYNKLCKIAFKVSNHILEFFIFLGPSPVACEKRLYFVTLRKKYIMDMQNMLAVE